jgi:hypothetical protein
VQLLDVGVSKDSIREKKQIATADEFIGLKRRKLGWVKSAITHIKGRFLCSSYVLYFPILMVIIKGYINTI